MATAPTALGPRRGRRAAASREEVLAAATYRYLRGLRVDVQAIASELGLGRTTIYRWFGSRDALIGEVLVRAADPLLDEARANARGRGARRLLDMFDSINRALVSAPALRQFLEQERQIALRILTSGAGLVQPHMVARIAGFVEEEVRAGNFDPVVEADTLAYAVVRLAEAFLYNDAGAGIRGDVEKLREVEALLLGLRYG
jgi:AcrR family transcriptional regulator